MDLNITFSSEGIPELEEQLATVGECLENLKQAIDKLNQITITLTEKTG